MLARFLSYREQESAEAFYSVEFAFSKHAELSTYACAVEDLVQVGVERAACIPIHMPKNLRAVDLERFCGERATVDPTNCAFKKEREAHRITKFETEAELKALATALFAGLHDQTVPVHTVAKSQIDEWLRGHMNEPEWATFLETCEKDRWKKVAANTAT